MGLFPRYLRHWDGNAGWDTMGTRWGTRWESYNDSHACNWDAMGTRWGTSWENKICPMPRYGIMNGTDKFLPSRRMGHSFVTGKCMRHASIDLHWDISALDWWCSLHWSHWSLHPRCTGLVVHCCANGRYMLTLSDNETSAGATKTNSRKLRKCITHTIMNLTWVANVWTYAKLILVSTIA